MIPSDTFNDVPLARLFSMAFRLLVDGLHDELRAAGWHDVRPAFGFVLLACRDQPTSAKGIAALMGTTKQAASKLIESMEEIGYVTRSASAVDGRGKDVELSSRGRELLGAVEQSYRTLETQWATVIGAKSVERMRADLLRVLLDANNNTLPPVRPT